MTEAIHPESLPGMGARIWKTRDGTEMRWADMKVSHLRNAANLVDRYTSEELNAAWRAYGSVQGEMAEYHIESAIDQLEHQAPTLHRYADEMRAYADWRARREGMVRQFLDVSSAHLSGDTHLWLYHEAILNFAGKDAHWHVAEHQDGWWVRVPVDTAPDNFPRDLLLVCDRARTLGAEYILFDHDAEPIADLPTYDGGHNDD